MKRIYLSLLSFVLSCSTVLFSQEDATLKELLRGKTKLSEILPVVKMYYTNPETINRLGRINADRYIKRWMRYNWYMSTRLGPNGEFVNISQKMAEATGLQQRRTLRASNGPNMIESSVGAWSPIGPMDTENGIGRVDRLAFHPTDANTVFAGTTAGGLWRTTDAGANWTNISPDIPSGGISGIAVNPDDTDSLYILTGDGDSNASGGLVFGHGYIRLSIGVLRSADGGTTWVKTGDFPGVDYTTLVGYRLVMHPAFNNILYACTNQGLFVTFNAGETWALSNGNGIFYNMKFKPGSTSVCYAVGRRADGNRTFFWRSTSSGFIWDSINAVNIQLNNPTARADLAVAQSNNSVVYLLAGAVLDSGLIKGVYRSDDSGLSFDLQSNTPNILGAASDGSDNDQQSWYDLTIATSNLTSATVVVGAIQAWRSLNSGVSWAYRGALHSDVHELAYHPVDNKLWAACDGGVYSSTDNGQNWTSHFADMNTTQFYRMAVNPEDYLSLIAGAQDNAVKRRTAGSSYFDQIACCDGFAVGYDPFNPDTMFAVTNKNIRRSYDGGDNFTNITPANSVNPFSMSLAVRTTLSNALIIGSDSTWRSTNGGSTWTVSSIDMGWYLRTCPSNGNRIYGAGGTSFSSTTGNLWRSDDGGASWGASLNGAGSGLPLPLNQRVTCINVDPNNSGNVWITFGGFTDGFKVFSSTNAGDTWTNRSGTLPNVPVNCIAIDINNNAYIGTDNGVYYRGTGMNDWVPYYNNLPYVPVTELVISETEGLIRAATFGRGIWSSSLYSACPVDLNVIGTLEGQEFYEASNNISSTASLLTSAGSKVQMRGGNEVLLGPGFTAREMTSFRAAIGPCGSGGVAGFRFATIDSSTKLDVRKYLPPSGGKKVLLHINAADNSSISFKLQQKINGNTEIILTGTEGNIVKRMENLSSAAGNSDHTMNTGTLAPGIYYLNVLVNKRWEHMQEVIIK